MATGDNILTAISVGRECNIINNEAEVFIADLKREGNIERLIWQSTQRLDNKLDETVLEPVTESARGNRYSNLNDSMRIRSSFL
jgi:cation-transporting ATPase 13A3/4/5